jgi:translation initiation factor 2 alpha subunit (eIF-2alpha)
LKFQERELGMVRLQKLTKVMDTYKKGKITLIDWLKIINEDKDWLTDVKQQIGIVLSKKYSSLNDAFYQISTGDKKLLFTAFDKWVRANHVLSGFMIN